MADDTWVYRLYSAADELLYVGVSQHVTRRIASHRTAKPWWDDVDTIRIERHPTRDLALRAEAVAIRTEAPRHNVQGVLTRGYQPAVRMLSDEQVREIVDAALARVEEHLQGMSHVEAVRELTELVAIARENRDAAIAEAITVDKVSYAAIADALRMTRQGARKRYGHLAPVG